jgi:hypothetical protein
MTDTIKIEKNIPIPKGGRPKGELRKVMEAMRVGDSILLSDKHIQHARALKSRCGVNITERKQSDGTFRVWRIAE